MKKYKLPLLLLAGVICAGLYYIYQPTGDYTRATCKSKFEDQSKYIRGIFDVTIMNSKYDEVTKSCMYALRLNEVLKGDGLLKLEQLNVRRRTEYPSCIETEKSSEKSCPLPSTHYLLFTADGSEQALNQEILLHHRFNYFQPIDKKGEVLKYLSKEN